MPITVMRAALCGLAFALAAAAAPATAQDVLPAEPFLRIEIGMHNSLIRDIAVDEEGGVIATASDDKTVRLWASDTGELLETIRPPMDLAEEGVVNTVAFWPGGSHILLSGINGPRYLGKQGEPQQNYVFFASRKSGYSEFLRRQPGGIVRKIAIHAEGAERRVAIAFVRNPTGVVVFDRRFKPVGAPILFDTGAQWVEFSRDGRLVAVSADGEIRLLPKSMDPAGVRVWRAPKGVPSQARFSPDGRRIAVAYADQNRIDILDAETMTAVGRLESRAASHLNVALWDAAGGLWAAGDLVVDDALNFAVRHWADPSRPDAWRDVKIGRDAATALERGRAGEIYFATAEPSWGRIDPQAHALIYARRAPAPDYRDLPERSFAVSADGARVAFDLGADHAAGPLLFDASRLVIEPRAEAAAAPPSPSPPPLGLKDWRNQKTPSLNGRILKLKGDQTVRSAAALTDGGVALGSDFRLSLFNASGQLVADRPVESAAFAVAATADGRRLVAAHADGAIRWYDLDPAQPLTEIAALFVHAETRRWILWSPDGYFTHSEDGGQDLAGFSVNRGYRRSAKWIEFSQLYRERHRRDLMASRVGRVAVSTPGAAPPTAPDDDLDKVAEAAPEVVIKEFCAVGPDGAVGQCYDATQARRALRRSKGAGAADAAKSFTLPAGVERLALRFEVAAPAERLQSVDVFLNGKATGRTTRALRRKAPAAAPAAPDAAPAAAVTTGERTIFLAPGENRISVRVYTTAGLFGKSSDIAIRADQPPAVVKPRLFVLAIGVNAYRSDAIQTLSYAVSDARSLTEHLKTAAGGEIYSSVETSLLLDAEATEPAITAQLKKIAETAQPQDSVVVYIAGHGVVGEKTGLYYFVHHDVSGLDAVETEGISQNRLIELIGAIRSQNILLMIDTCHSGAFPAEAAGAIVNETGYYVLAASSDAEQALDGYNARNGVFAHAVLTGLRGGAPSFDGVIDTLQLGTYVRRKVPKLALEKGHRQSAQFRSSGGDLRDFPIAKVQ